MLWTEDVDHHRPEDRDDEQVEYRNPDEEESPDPHRLFGRRHIDGDAELFGLFDGIRDSAQRIREALLKDDWQTVSATMREAYPNRKRLAPGVTTPQMDAIVERALQNGAEAAKVCGAGGGGCIAFLCAEGRREMVERALVEEGVEVLDWKLAREGLVVRES